MRESGPARFAPLSRTETGRVSRRESLRNSSREIAELERAINLLPRERPADFAEGDL